MADILHMTLRPSPGVTLSPGPFHARDDGTIVANDGRTLCVLGDPNEDMAEQDVANGAAVIALPDLIGALIDLHFNARPENWDDDEDPEQVAAWKALDAALAKAGVQHWEPT